MLSGAGALLIFAGPLAAQALALDPPGYHSPQTVPLSLERVFATDNNELDIDGVDDHRVDVDIAVLDTGVKLDHPDLNMVARIDCTDATQANGYTCTNASPSAGSDDGEKGLWHGTSTALNIAGLDNDLGGVGIAAGARIWAMDTHKALLGGPSPLDPTVRDLGATIAGVKWVTAHADEIEVAQLGFLCAPEQTEPLPLPRCGPDPDDPDLIEELVAELDAAVEESIAAGVVYIAGAGNWDENVSKMVPQRFEDVIVVSGMADSDGEPGELGGQACEVDDDHSWGSDWGAVDVTAPGCATSTTSTYPSGAAAVLASSAQYPTEDASDVADIGAAIFGGGDCDQPDPESPDIGAANCDWTDDSPDGILEPLLDVHDEAVFNPEMVPGCDIPSAPEVESDVDGDGHSDLITLRPDGHVFVHGGNANLQFEAGVESFSKAYRGEAPIPSALFVGEGHYVIDVADVTADGCADLTTLSSDKNLYVYPGKPDRTFGFGVLASAAAPGLMASALLQEGGHEPIAVEDVDGDGHADLVTYRDLLDDVRVFLGNTDGTFDLPITGVPATVSSALHTGAGEYFLDLADVTGDGKADLVSMTTSDEILVRPGKADGTFDDAIGSSSTIGSIDTALDDGDGYEPVGLGDVTGDGYADLALVKAGTLYLYPGNATGRFGTAATSFGGLAPSSTFGSGAVEMLGLPDVDGDGSADIAGALSATDKVKVYLGDSSGVFKTSATSDDTLLSTQHFQNQDSSGSEFVTEKPAIRRRGCEPMGCDPAPPDEVAAGFGAVVRDGNIDVYPVDSDGDIRQRSWSAATGWSSWSSHGAPSGGATTTGSTAVSSDSDTVHILVGGADSSAWQKTWSDGSGWSSWASFSGSGIAGGPALAAASPEEGEVHAFARVSSANDAVYRKIWIDGSGWGLPSAVPNTTATGLDAVSRQGGLVDLFYRESDGDIAHRWWTSAGGWSDPAGNHASPPSGASTSAPAAASTSANDIHLFVRGVDNALWEKVWTNGSGWTSWTSLGGVLHSGPTAVSPAEGEVHVFARAANDSLHRKIWTDDDGWSGWEPVGTW